MRRRDISSEELARIIRLRDENASWLKIQREAGVPRRIAQRAYVQWGRSQAREELKEARKDVAAQAFREHMDSLVTLATFFVMNLKVPHLPELMDNSEQFSRGLFEGDLLQRGPYISPLHAEEAYAPFTPRPVVDPQSYRREKELLFESLKVHTRGEGVRWEALKEWEQARDNCKRVLDKLREETGEVVNNSLIQERETNFLQRVKEGSRENDPAKQMVEVVLRVMWRAILRDKLDEEGHWFQTVPRRMGPPEDIDIIVKSKDDEKVLTFIGETNMGLAETVTRICELVANNLYKGDTVQQLHNEVHKMKKASDELHDMLNAVKLRPMILRTRCDLCPA
jgi:hypothetical protein